MCYILCINIKEPLMTPRDEMQKIKNTIKYDTRRAYFGEWTPAQIHAIYHDAMDNFEHKIALNIGTLSVDAVCGVLWNEMSYNPIHFGSVSPFMFHGKNDIKQFIDTPTNDKTLNIVKELLKTFLSTAEKIDKAFDEFVKDKEIVDLEKLESIKEDVDNQFC